MPGQADKNRATIATARIDAAQIDARGLRCPLPALRLAKAVREGGAGSYILLADDPAAEADIPALSAERGWTLLSSGKGRFEIRT